MTWCAEGWSACGWGRVRGLHHLFRDLGYVVEELVCGGHLLRFVLVAVRVRANCDLLAVDASL